VLRRIFESKKNEVTGGWRKLHNEELDNFCCPLNIIRMIKEDEMYRTCSTHRVEEGYMQSFGKRPLRKPRRRQDDNVNVS
jgi:hypothetical protein